MVITEFGCCTYHGAGAHDSMGWMVAMLDGGRRVGKYPDLGWEPKLVFDAMALRYGRQRSTVG